MIERRTQIAPACIPSRSRCRLSTNVSGTSATPACSPPAQRLLSAPLEGEGVPAAGTDGDPAQLGELVHDREPAEAAEAGVLDAAERHLRLVRDRLVVDVDDPRVDLLRQRKAALAVARDDPGAQSVARAVRLRHRVL